MKKVNSIDEYIAQYPKDVQAILQRIRQTIQKAAPEATEKISYGIPTFTFHGNLVHFGGFKDHISFFPTAAGIEAFKEELGPYAVSKGTVHFPLDKALPLHLVQKIVKYRVKQNIEGKRQ